MIQRAFAFLLGSCLLIVFGCTSQESRAGCCSMTYQRASTYYSTPVTDDYESSSPDYTRSYEGPGIGYGQGADDYGF